MTEQPRWYPPGRRPGRPYLCGGEEGLVVGTGEGVALFARPGALGRSFPLPVSEFSLRPVRLSGKSEPDSITVYPCRPVLARGDLLYVASGPDVHELSLKANTVRQVSLGQKPCSCLALSGDGRTLAVGAANEVFLFAFPSFKPFMLIEVQEAWMESTSFNTDLKPQRVRLPGGVRSVCLDEGATLLVCSDGAGVAKVFHLTGEAAVGPSHLPFDTVRQVRWAAGRHLFLLLQRRLVRYDLGTLNVVWEYVPPNGGSLRYLDLSPDGSRVLISPGVMEVTVLDAADGRELSRMNTGEVLDGPEDAVFLGSGRIAMAAASGRLVYADVPGA
jgi:hypothetical protein